MLLQGAQVLAAECRLGVLLHRGCSEPDTQPAGRERPLEDLCRFPRHYPQDGFDILDQERI